MDRNLALDFVRATEAAAIASARWMGRGDNHAADHAAVEAMRGVFSSVPIKGKVVIGEGERDEAPMLYIGEEVGSGGPEIDIAVDPLEGTNITARGGYNSISVLAAAPRGMLLHAPDTYMDKIAVGPQAEGAIDLDASVSENIQAVADKLDKKCDDITVVVLDRERHAQLIKDIRACGARIQLISDGDIAGGLATALPDSELDMLMGIGAAPEGVITAAGLKTLGGEIQGRLHFRNEEEKARAKKMGISDPGRKFSTDDMAKGNDLLFAATGVTTGAFLRGVRFTAHGAVTHSIVMRSKSRTVRYVEAVHHFEHKETFT